MNNSFANFKYSSTNGDVKQLMLKISSKIGHIIIEIKKMKEAKIISDHDTLYNSTKIIGNIIEKLEKVTEYEPNKDLKKYQQNFLFLIRQNVASIILAKNGVEVAENTVKLLEEYQQIWRDIHKSIEDDEKNQSILVNNVQNDLSLEQQNQSADIINNKEILINNENTILKEKLSFEC